MQSRTPRIGIDLLEISRMAKLESTPGLAEQLFTAGEIAHCRSHRIPNRAFALCFAAKEAFFKACGLGLHSGTKFSEIEITFAHPHQPKMSFHGTLQERFADKFHCQLSVGSSREMACAVVTLEEMRNN